MPIVKFELQLTEKKLLTPKIVRLSFTRADGEKLGFIPGQFITFDFEHNGKIVKRSYSIASLQTPAEQIEIAVSPVAKGLATTIFENLKTSETLNASGPYGRLILPTTDLPKQIVLVATGTGVAPYRAMLPQIETLLKSFPTTQFTLLFGVQYRQDLFYVEDFLSLANKEKNFVFRAYLSREENLNAPYEQKGYVQSAFTELNLDATNDLVFLCGNPNMIDDAFALLVDAGFPTGHVKREKYISAPTR